MSETVGRPVADRPLPTMPPIEAAQTTQSGSAQHPTPRRPRWGWVVALVTALLVVPALVFGSIHLISQGRWASAVDSGDCLKFDPATAPAGACVAVLRLPRFGADWAVPVYASTSAQALSGGVGWYAGTTVPGQIGNCVLVGYRLGGGGPFNRLAELAAGDQVTIETAQGTYHYTIATPATALTVGRDDSWVLDPVPGADLAPTNALLTLVTAQDLWPTPDRSVAIAQLTEN